MWLAAVEAARDNRKPAEDTEPPNGPPPPSRWAKRKPEAAARLEAARAALSQVSERVGVPTENLVSPDLVRRLCWDWETVAETGSDPLAAVDEFLRNGLAREWQRELVDPVLAAAVQPEPDS